MKFAIPLMTSLVLCLGVRSQSWRPFVTVGASQYIGDIPDQSVASLARGLVGAGLQYRSQGRFRLNLEGVLTQLKASDAGTSNASRNLSFTTWLTEASLTGRIDLVKKPGARVVPYLSGGVAMFYVNPWATSPSGKRVSLYSLSTEGQGIGSGPAVPSNLNVSIPFGGGFDLALGKTLRVDVEWILRKTFTDHIDDVGGNYPDRQSLLAAKGPEAVAMSWRGSGAFPRAGTARGNLADKDWYAAVQMRFRVQGKRAKKDKTPRALSSRERKSDVKESKPVVREEKPDRKEPTVPAEEPVAEKKAKTSKKKQRSDKDGDGVPDDIDNCPEVVGTARRNGCPVPDTDMDGVNDDEDICPSQPGSKEDRGCPPLDRDRDGIPDNRDKCPDLAGTARYFGCPIPDADKDGVSDEEDKCPDLPGKRELLGCPVADQDSDGVEDRFDRCVTVPGIDTLNGCPLLPIQASRVGFMLGTSTLTASARLTLDTLARWLMDVRPQLQIVIESHVDAGKGPLAAKQLSEARAMAVYVYLFNKRVPISRMQAVGIGSEQPVADNRTQQGRARNNRVEFRLSE
ncbi:MAG: OmpA family protein [Chitinophagia bacterium]|nr:OmpA family protein [Chitinophagia bacterium]